jgi:2-dehydro-3-deoxyglucarate aldolase/4-hydroxy-2-oxoheptanedioate aldolase
MKFKGIMLSEINFPPVALILKKHGYDFMIIDCEHGPFDYRAAADIILTCRLTGLQVFVRVPDNRREVVIKYKDMGADGLILPMTESPEQIARVVGYCKYPPDGKRGVSTMRAHTLYNPGDLRGYMAAANSSGKVFAQIETAAGLSRIGEVCAVKGVDGVFFGPNDFAADCGCIGLDKTPVLNALKAVARGAAASGKSAGIITSDKELLLAASSEQYAYYSIGSELSALDASFGSAAKDFCGMIR